MMLGVCKDVVRLWSDKLWTSAMLLGSLRVALVSINQASSCMTFYRSLRCISADVTLSPHESCGQSPLVGSLMKITNSIRSRSEYSWTVTIGIRIDLRYTI